MSRSERDTEISARQIARRGLIFGGLQLGVVGVLAARMRFIQVDQADEFRLLAEDNRINIRLLPPERGLIFDRNGATLAENDQNYRITITREETGDVEEVVARLSRLISMDPHDLERARREIDSRSPFVPVVLADRLSWEEVARVAVNAPALPGVTPEAALSRRYPLEGDFAHVVGYVGPVSDTDLVRDGTPDPVLQLPGFQIGKTGVEAKRERELRGGAGTRRIEVNAAGRVMREIDRAPGEPGATLQLTVDAGLQNYAQARLDGESASAVVLDVESGEILAIASAPSFDPNKFVRGISSRDYAKLIDTPYRPLANKTVQGLYPPGSTFKMVTALAALDAGVVRPDEMILCTGHKDLGDRRFHCWKPDGHGLMDLSKSISRSCDVYYYDVAERVGVEGISEMARRLGFGQQFDLPLSGIADGLAPNREWARENRGREWVTGDTLNVGVGQGMVLATPLQLAVMSARLATGRAVVPTLVKSVDGIQTERARARSLGLDPEHLRLVRAAMREVSNDWQGTAFSSRIVAPEAIMAGKTGTSQVRNITVEERAEGVVANEDLPWERRDHALFVAFAPFDAPRVACSVVVEHGGSGSRAAAPLARDILLQALYGGLPPLDAYPAGQRGTVLELRRRLPLRPPPAQSSERRSRA